MEKGQTGRWSKAERELLQKTFGDNEELIYQIRDIFYQFPTKPLVLNADVMSLLRKVFDPQLDQNVPLRNQEGLHRTVNVDNIPPEIAVLQLEAVDLMSDYIQDRLRVLEGKEPHAGTLQDLKAKGNKTPQERYITMKAYLMLVHSYIDMCIETLKESSKKEKTKEELAKEAKQNSTK